MKSANRNLKVEAPIFWEDESDFTFNEDRKHIQSCRLHYHAKAELYLLLEGEGKYFIDDNVYNVKAGEMVFIPPNVLHKTNYFGNTPRSRLLIHFSTSFLPESTNKLLLALNHHTKQLPSSLGNIEKMFRKIQQEYESPDNYSDEMIKNHLSSLAVMIARASAKYHTMNINSKSQFIKQAVSYIKENYSSQITLADIAQHSMVSRVYLSRSFKKETGFGVNEYLNVYRLKQAEAMLIDSPQKTILDVALACGFNNSNYFTECFKKRYGYPPSQLRKEKTPGN